MKEFIRKDSELKKIKKNDQESLELSIDLLIKEAKERGYDSVLDYVKATFQCWDKSATVGVVDEIYENFLLCVQEGVSKEPWGNGKWDTNSTFREFLSHTLKQIDSRLEELEWKKKTRYPAFAGLIKLLPDMTNVPKGVGESMSMEDYEFYELILRKTKEIVSSMLNNDQYYEEIMKEIENGVKTKEYVVGG
jgi:hypothetical protein